eukprot:GEMP01039380.1.p1 GENE.GEMP01039380.1~~GEMP01039380.1.p1  ORF type:complete len:347 (+),score=55.18 GEMP01039380.1:109-1149(+)
MLYVAALSVIVAGQNYVNHARNEGRKMTEWEFGKSKERCDSKCIMTCGSGDRDVVPDSWQPGKFFLETCQSDCLVGAAYCNVDPAYRYGDRGVCYNNPVIQHFQKENQDRYTPEDCIREKDLCHKACKLECKRQFDALTLCQPARQDDEVFLTEQQALDIYGLDFCKFLAEVALGPRYRKPVAKVDYIYRRGSVVPKTTIKRDNLFWGTVLTGYKCDPSDDGCLQRRNVSDLVEESLDEWFYQPCREEDGCQLPDPEVANPMVDHERFLTVGIGKTCKVHVKENDEEQEDCGQQCRNFCYYACNCHFGPYRYAAYAEGRGSEVQWWNYQGLFYCYERQENGSKLYV